MLLDRAWIAGRIPHQGAMCLLDAVIDWGAERICCRTGSHRSIDNPLRSHGRLGVACGIEYAAQTMAVHAALLVGAYPVGSPGDARARCAATAPPPTAGFLAGVRGVRFHVPRLDEVADDIFCEAERTAGDRGMALYGFVLRSGSRRLLDGRATVVLDAQGLSPR